MVVQLLLDISQSTIVEIYKVYMTDSCTKLQLLSTIVEIYKVYMTWTKKTFPR